MPGIPALRRDIAVFTARLDTACVSVRAASILRYEPGA